MEYFFRKKNGTIKVSLPTDIRKEGSAYDLTLAIGILAASEQIAGAAELEDYYIMGELSLDGSLQPKHRNRPPQRGHQFQESGPGQLGKAVIVMRKHLRKDAEIFYLCRPKSIPMPLHRKKHYDQRRRLMKQPFETQEKAQQRLDYVFYAVIAVAIVVAMSFSLFKDHNIGRAVFFFLFLIWWTYFAFKSDLHRLAKKKGWETVAKMTYDPKAEKPNEEAALREERLKNPIDTETLIVMENVTNLEDLEAILFDYVEVECNTLCDDLPLLWKVGENRYAVTFPCGISRKPFYELMDNLICFLDMATVYGWCRPDLFKKKGDGWLFLRNGDEDMLVAYSDDGTLWNIDATDAILRNPHYANGFKEYPTIDWDSAEQLGVYY